MLPTHLEIEICDAKDCVLSPADTAAFCRIIVAAVGQRFGCPVACTRHIALFDQIRVYGTSFEREQEIRDEVAQIIQDVWPENFENIANGRTAHHGGGLN